jgi:hypothetical protein
MITQLTSILPEPLLIQTCGLVRLRGETRAIAATGKLTPICRKHSVVVGRPSRFERHNSSPRWHEFVSW